MVAWPLVLNHRKHWNSLWVAVSVGQCQRTARRWCIGPPEGCRPPCRCGLRSGCLWTADPSSHPWWWAWFLPAWGLSLETTVGKNKLEATYVSQNMKLIFTKQYIIKHIFHVSMNGSLLKSLWSCPVLNELDICYLIIKMKNDHRSINSSSTQSNIHKLPTHTLNLDPPIRTSLTSLI